jgi:hypothetical protein
MLLEKAGINMPERTTKSQDAPPQLPDNFMELIRKVGGEAMKEVADEVRLSQAEGQE